jgi:ribulose-phosphate 3-epimerase
MIVIPSINETSFAEVLEQLRKAESFLRPGDWIHIDVADGIFTPIRTWGVPDELASLRTALSVELHLMITEPEQHLAQYLSAIRSSTSAQRRIIFQHETMRDPSYILSQCRDADVEAGLSLMLEAKPEFLALYLRDFLFLNVLAVPPGPSGQRFQSSVLPKIQLLKQQHPNVILEIDGGITSETARLVKDSGADVIVSGSYIFESPSPRAAYEELTSM